MEVVASFFGRNGFLPHGYCFTWSPGLLWAMVVSDLVIAAAYLSIPVAIFSFTRQRGEDSNNGVAWLFGAFILACGTTHIMGVWTVWQPDYGAQALTKVVTAGISFATAVAVWPLIPKALKVPSVARLQLVISSLEAEVQRRRGAEDTLSEIQQNLAVTLASIGAGFIATDRSGGVTRMNGVAERLTGWSQTQALGQSLWTVFEREDRPATYASMNPVDVMIESDFDVDTVHRAVAVARDGRRTAVEVQAALTHEDDGTVRGLALVLRDMTQSVRAEAESARLGAIVESSSDAIISKTLEGVITTWNPAAEAMFGYRADDAVGQSVQMLVPADRRHEATRILVELRRGQRVPPFDTQRLAKDGRVLDVSVSISPIRDRQGRLIGASKIARDITRQRQDAAALRDSEARLRFTLESAHIGDWDLDLATGIAHHSLIHDRCFGFTEPEAEWSFDKFVEFVHPDDRAEAAHTLHVAVTELRDWRLQCRVIWPDDSVHWISVHGSALLVDGKPTRMLGIVTDITEQRQAEDARLKAQRLEAENRQIQEANRLKSQFLANMSHELRTPLNAVIGFADLLQTGFVKPDSPHYLEYVGHIGTSGRHLLQLINDVLDLSKVESGKFEFHPQAVDLAVVFKEVKAILHNDIQRKGITVNTEIDATVTDLSLDPSRLKQVLYNYLSNAIKFTASGGTVTVRTVAQGPEHFRLEVEDTGIGIAAADLPRLFTEFQQLDTGYSKQHQGTGLGLALTRRLVQAQGGRVGVRSTPGVGSVFSIVLNRVHGVDASRITSQENALKAADRVLLIEGDHLVQEHLSAAFTEAGFDVDAAADGGEALRQAHVVRYDALTLALQLPSQRGLDLLASIRRHGASQTSPVLSVSMPAAATAATFAIANLLCKPIRGDEIELAMAPFKLKPPGRANVLVIDDDQQALHLMQSTLKGIGIDAVGVLDGRDALRDIEQIRPDAIILDLMMPQFDGFQVLDALQRLSAWRHVPVYIWTSLLLTDDEYATLARSARAILIKGGSTTESILEGVRRWRAHEASVNGGDPP
jgi:PAS domain S-box-containing protein